MRIGNWFVDRNKRRGGHFNNFLTRISPEGVLVKHLCTPSVSDNVIGVELCDHQ